MEKIIYFDYAAVATFGLLIIACAVRKMIKGHLNRDFFILVLIGFISTFSDIMAITLDEAGNDYIVWKYIFHSLYLFFHSATLPYYLIYIIDLTGTRHLTLDKPTYKILVFLPLEIEAFLLVLNAVTGYVFHFGAAGEYIRGPLFFLNYLIAGFYMVLSLVHMFRYQKALLKGSMWSIFVLFPVVLAAMAVQYFFPKIVIEMFACSICYLYIGMIVMRPEEMTDSDTGFMKTDIYAERLKRSRINKATGSVLMINISNYRALQHSLGYKASLELLSLISDRILVSVIRSRLRGYDLYHLGEGKFRIIVGNGERPILLQSAKEIQKDLSEGFLFRNAEISILTNVCILHWPDDIGDFDNLMLFESQLEEIPFRGEVLFAKELMKESNFDIIKSIDSIMEKALKDHTFEVYYQPIYSVKEKKFTTAEALLRLKTEEFGFIPPDIFIPAAERNGAIHRIGRYVLEEVCRFIAEDGFKELGLECIDVNLSTIQCLEKNLAREISKTLSDHNVDPKQINLEITESATSSGQSEMLANIENLSARGFKFSLDDYGTGYSNISRAVSMPLSVIKLDKSIARVEKDTKLYSISRNTVRMIKDMDMQIVVEGIEDEKTLQIFEEMGCDYIQGYYFSKPLPKKEFVDFIRRFQVKERTEE